MIRAVLALGLVSLYFPSATPDPICPVLEAKQDFNKFKFQGRWLVQGTWKNPYNSKLECNILNYGLEEGNRVKITDKGYNPESRKVETTFKVARIPDSTDPAYWELSSEVEDEWIGDYLILETDYWNYAVVYTCTVDKGKRITHAWVMSKQSFPKRSDINRALEIASRFGFERPDFIRMDRLEADCYGKFVPQA